MACADIVAQDQPAYPCSLDPSILSAYLKNMGSLTGKRLL